MHHKVDRIIHSKAPFQKSYESEKRQRAGLIDGSIVRTWPPFFPEFFQRYGRYHPIDVTVKKREKEKQLQNELTVYSILNNDVNRDILTKIFQYHLETVLFCPKLELENFILFYKDYMNNTWEDYIKKGFTDILFTYADSGDFSVIFRTDIYEQEQLFTEINEIILDS